MSQLRTSPASQTTEKYTLNGTNHLFSLSSLFANAIIKHVYQISLTSFSKNEFIGEGDVEERFFTVPLDHDSPKKGTIQIFVRIIKEHEVPLKAKDKPMLDYEESPAYCQYMYPT